MTSDLSKLNYTSQYPIDKVVVDDQVATPLTYTGIPDLTQTTQTVPNTFGQKCFVTLSWSVNGTDYYPAQAYTAANAPYTANGWTDSALVYIFLENFSGGTVDFWIKFTLDTIE